jgi:hypothetical protein
MTALSGRVTTWNGTLLRIGTGRLERFPFQSTLLEHGLQVLLQMFSFIVHLSSEVAPSHYPPIQLLSCLLPVPWVSERNCGRAEKRLCPRVVMKPDRMDGSQLGARLSQDGALHCLAETNYKYISLWRLADPVLVILEARQGQLHTAASHAQHSLLGPRVFGLTHWRHLGEIENMAGEARARETTKSHARRFLHPLKHDSTARMLGSRVLIRERLTPGTSFPLRR